MTQHFRAPTAEAHCKLCGYPIMKHVVPSYGAVIASANATRSSAEADVRRIVREELAAAKGEK